MVIKAIVSGFCEANLLALRFGSVIFFAALIIFFFCFLDILLCPFKALKTEVTDKPILLAKSLIFIRFLIHSVFIYRSYCEKKRIAVDK